MVVQKIAQGLASQVIEGHFLAGRRQGRGQVQVMADPDIEGTLARLLRCVAQGLARSEVVVHRLPECGVQFCDGFCFVAHQRLDEQNLAEQAVVFEAGFDRADVAIVFQLVVH